MPNFALGVVVAKDPAPILHMMQGSALSNLNKLDTNSPIVFSPSDPTVVKHGKTTYVKLWNYVKLAVVASLCRSTASGGVCQGTSRTRDSNGLQTQTNQQEWQHSGEMWRISHMFPQNLLAFRSNAMGKGVLPRFAKYNKVVQVLQLPLHLASIQAQLFANPATQPARNRAKWPWPMAAKNIKPEAKPGKEPWSTSAQASQPPISGANTDLGWKMMTGPIRLEAKPSIAKPSLRILPDFCQAPMHADLVVGSEEFVASQGRPGGDSGRWCSVIIQHAIHIDSSCCHDLNMIIHHIHDIWWWWNWVQTKKVNKSQEEPRAIHRKREREREKIDTIYRTESPKDIPVWRNGIQVLCSIMFYPDSTWYAAFSSLKIFDLWVKKSIQKQYIKWTCYSCYGSTRFTQLYLNDIFNNYVSLTWSQLLSTIWISSHGESENWLWLAHVFLPMPHMNAYDIPVVPHKAVAEVSE